MNPSYHRLRRFAALLLGVVFLVSGLLKIIDPVGTMLIVKEYFKLLHLSFLFPTAKVTGILLALLEALLGIALITGVLRKTAARFAFVLLGFFTLLTLWLWISNPAMDCGCFGLAIHLTHAQSFWKNVIMLLLAAFAFLPFHSLGTPKRDRKVAAVLSVLSVLFVVYYSNTHLPIVDFTEYDWGAELYASLEDEILAENRYNAAYVYEKDGEEESFDLSALPDSSWTFVRVDTVFRKSAAVAETHPMLSFRDGEGEYRDSEAAEGRVVVFSVYEPAKLDWIRLEGQCQEVLASGGRAIVLLSDLPEKLRELPVPTYFADYKTLITLNRSNGGGTYFHEGELVNKWDAAHFPENLSEDFSADPVDLSTRYIVKRRLYMQGFCVYLAALLLLV